VGQAISAASSFCYRPAYPTFNAIKKRHNLTLVGRLVDHRILTGVLLIIESGGHR
jgi:hypothetical protein